MSKLRTIAQEACRGTTIWLEGFLGFKTRMVTFKVTGSVSCSEILHGKSVGCVYPSMLYLGICLTTEKKHGKTCHYSQRVPVGYDSMCQHGRSAGNQDNLLILMSLL
jgi:hypothetical protein